MDVDALIAAQFSRVLSDFLNQVQSMEHVIDTDA